MQVYSTQSETRAESDHQNLAGRYAALAGLIVDAHYPKFSKAVSLRVDALLSLAEDSYARRGN